MSKSDITHARLLEVLSYDPDTGVFTWKIATNRRTKLGSPAGSLHQMGYIEMRVEGVRCFAHRLAHFYVYGSWPTGSIDHKDGDKLNNAIANLRDVTHRVNMENTRVARSSNALGILGVRMTPKGRFRACLQVKGRNKDLGTYDTPAQASAAYVKAKRDLHEGCTL